MKSINYTIAIAVALTCFASCQKEDFGGFSSDPDAVQITATVGNPTKTRVNPVGETEADRTTFTDGEQIKVSADSQDAVTYMLENGVWKPASGTYLKWITTSMKFNAYYPVTYTGGADATAKPDQSSLPEIMLADYMKAENIVWDKSIGAVEFSMQRQTARVVISEIKWGNQYDTNVYKLSDLTLSDGVSGRIKPYEHEDGKYYALLMPTAGKTGLSGNFMEMTVWDGKDASPKEGLIVKDIPEFEAGYSYECTLTIGKDKAEITSVTVEEWATGGTFIDGEGLTEEHLGYTVAEIEGVKTYIVEDAFGLKTVNRIMASDVNELSSNIILAADITLTGENNWIPIGDRYYFYTGIFDGNGKTITGLHINNESDGYQALIANASGGMVKNLTLVNGFITGSGNYVGGVIGRCASSIMNVTVKDCEINGMDYVGGVVAHSTSSIMSDVTVKDCEINGMDYVGGAVGFAQGKVTVSGTTLLDSEVRSSGMYAGGIVGATDTKTFSSAIVNIENCLVQSNAGNTVTIDAGTSYAGGIVGFNENGNIYGCKVINSGELTISSNETHTGGIAGLSFNNIGACLVQGAKVTASSNAGGIVGQLSGNLSNNYAYNCTTGTTPEAFTGVANIVGTNNGTVTSCYYHAYNDSWEDLVTPVPNSSGELEPGTPVDWITASENMNRSLNESGYRYVWGGTYDAPTLTAL